MAIALRLAAAFTVVCTVDAALLPIFFMHGLGANHNMFAGMQSWIKAIDPNVLLYALPLFDDEASNTNLWDQGDAVMSAIRARVNDASLRDAYKDGYMLVCHSQGALLCRTVIERMDDHNVHTLLALAGPQMGQYGIPDDMIVTGVKLKELLPWGRDLAYSFLFSHGWQEKMSFANYWYDPRPTAKVAFGNAVGEPIKSYLRGNTFLPVFNNDPARDTQGPGIKKSNAEAARYKANFLRLKRAVFTCGNADVVVKPFASGIWDYYDPTASTIVFLEQTQMWAEDWLGLRELSESNRLVRTIAPGVDHAMWVWNQAVFTQHIAPHIQQVPLTSMNNQYNNAYTAMPTWAPPTEVPDLAPSATLRTSAPSAASGPPGKQIPLVWIGLAIAGALCLLCVCYNLSGLAKVAYMLLQPNKNEPANRGGALTGAVE